MSFPPRPPAPAPHYPQLRHVPVPPPADRRPCNCSWGIGSYPPKEARYCPKCGGTLHRAGPSPTFVVGCSVAEAEEQLRDMAAHWHGAAPDIREKVAELKADYHRRGTFRRKLAHTFFTITQIAAWALWLAFWVFTGAGVCYWASPQPTAAAIGAVAGLLWFAAWTGTTTRR